MLFEMEEVIREQCMLCLSMNDNKLYFVLLDTGVFPVSFSKEVFLICFHISFLDLAL